MIKIPSYKFYILDRKKCGLFPREKFIFKALKGNNYNVNKIYHLVPFKFWSIKSFITIKYLLKYLIYLIFGKNYLNTLIKDILFNGDIKDNQYLNILNIVNESLIDATNKSTNTLLTKGIKNFFIWNLKWRIIHTLFSSSLCAILDKLGYKILSLEKTCFLIGDIYYAHETILSILLLFKNKELSRENNLMFFSGIFYSELKGIKSINQLRIDKEKYSADYYLKINHHAKENSKQVFEDKKVRKYTTKKTVFKDFILYPPCVSDSYFFTQPNVYTSQFNWAEDLFEIFQNKEINIKMHPKASDYNDLKYWSKLFKSLAKKYNVKTNFLNSSLKIDDVIDLGYYPLSPKGTVGLELIERNLPSIVLASNVWTYNYPDLTIYNREDYKKLIKKASKKNIINSSLEIFKPSKLNVSLAHTIQYFDRKDFYYSIGIKGKDLPNVPFGYNNRSGEENLRSDKLLEKEYLTIIDNKYSRLLLIKLLNKIL